jgi:hypothetical protein
VLTADEPIGSACGSDGGSICGEASATGALTRAPHFGQKLEASWMTAPHLKQYIVCHALLAQHA